MKNMKISRKLITGFVLVIVFAVIVGAVGIVGMSRINEADNGLYNDNYLPTVTAGRISQLVVEQSVYIRNLVIYGIIYEREIFTASQDSLHQSDDEMTALLAEYEKTITHDDDWAAYNEFVALYNGEWKDMRVHLEELGISNDMGAAKKVLTESAVTSEKLHVLTGRLQEINMNAGKETVDANTSLYISMAIVEVIVLLVVIVISLLLASHISSLIAKPLGRMKTMMEQVGRIGSLTIAPALKSALDRDAMSRDEIGESIVAFQQLISHIISISGVLQTISSGDLRSEIHLLSSEDELGVALKKMQDNLNNMFGEINLSTKQVSSGSKQIADGAQSLAQGSTEQAAAIEKLSASIVEIANKTQENAKMAIHAAELSGAIRNNAQTGSAQMNQMMEAVREINEASQSINKVIKIIDDIAFQTNILALNAAVEAARAGQHGRGFAVVAEEVRNLAAKSAAAAKDTGSMIQNSIEKAELGARIADETSESLREIVSGINESTEIVNDIARSSEEQSEAIKEINTGIDQVANVVSQNSATAEQSASSSEQMNGQSEILQNLVAQFKLKGQENQRLAYANAPAPQDLPQEASDDGFGKY